MQRQFFRTIIPTQGQSYQPKVNLTKLKKTTSNQKSEAFAAHQKSSQKAGAMEDKLNFNSSNSSKKLISQKIVKMLEDNLTNEEDKKELQNLER